MIARGMRLALLESAVNLREFDRWGTLAWFDTVLRYRRTVLGPWWLTLSTGTMIGSVGLIWGTIFGMDVSSYMPFFATGFIIWSFVSGSLLQGCDVFTQAGNLIKSVPRPLMIHVHRLLARQLIILAHNAVLIVLVWAIFQWPMGWSALLAIPGLLILTVAMTGAVLLLGILCTRFRDIPPIVTALLQLVFLLTPIIWMPSSVRGKATSALLDFNPFYYLVEVVRGPLLNAPPDWLMWLLAVATALASLLIGHAFYGRFQHRVAYWL